MAGPQSRGGNSAKNKDYKKARRTRRRKKDVDQIQDEIKLHSIGKFKQELDEDLPAMGQIRCIPCSRFFINERTLQQHSRTKDHKKRLKAVQRKQYTQEEAEMAAGMGKPVNR